MKWRALFTASGLILISFLAACASGDRQNTTAVTVAVGGVKTAQNSGVVSKATPTIASLTFTISGPGMEPIVRIVPVSPPQTITEVFYILNGPARNFFIEAKDAAGTAVYSGGVYANLDGTPITLTLPLQALLFSDLIWTPWADEAASIAKDPDGNSIIAGHTYGDLDGANADATHGTPDVFVTKLTPTGARLWTRQLGTPGFDICYSAVTDSVGNVYLAGSTSGGLEGQTKTGRSDAFVLKLDSSGAVVWTRLIGAAGYFTFGNAVTVDDAGNVYLAGNTEGGLVSAPSGSVVPNQDPNNAPNGPGNTYDVFVAKYDAAGVFIWTQQLGASGVSNDTGEGLAFVPGGAYPAGVIVTGSTSSAFAGGAHQGSTDVYVAKLDALSGALSWMPQQFGTPDEDDAWAVAVDSTGMIYVAGGTYGDLDLQTNKNSGTSDMFVAKYDSAYGSKSWTRLLGSIANDTALGLAVDSGGNVIVTGSTNGDFDGIAGDGGKDVFLVKYDQFGAWQWTRELGTRADDEGTGVLVGSGDSLTVMGNTSGAFTSFPTEDVFILKYDAAGTKQ